MSILAGLLDAHAGQKATARWKVRAVDKKLQESELDGPISY